MACRSAEEARQRVEEAEKRIAEIRGRSRERSGSIEDKMSRLATEEKKLHGYHNHSWLQDAASHSPKRLLAHVC